MLVVAVKMLPKVVIVRTLDVAIRLRLRVKPRRHIRDTSLP